MQNDKAGESARTTRATSVSCNLPTFTPLPQEILDDGDDGTLPSVDDIIHSPISTNYLFQAIPAAARPALSRILMKVLSQCITMAAQPQRALDAKLTLHMILRAVTRRLWKGETGWKDETTQSHSVMNRITRAMRGNHWNTLWKEAHNAFTKARKSSHNRTQERRPQTTSRSQCNDQGRAMRARARRVTELASKGFYNRALHAAQATLGADTRDGDVLAQLKALYPKRRISIANRSIDCLPRAVEVTEEHVQHAFLRMDTTASAGTDTMSVRLVRLFLLDVALVGPNETGLTALTSFVNLALRGLLPQKAHQLLASARLVAILKGSGKIRPVAVGNVLRRLIAKCTCY